MNETRHYDDPEILGPEEERAEKVQRNFFRVLRRAASRIPFAEELVAAYYCAFDRETPTRVRATLLAALAYFVMPFDVIPDFLVIAGFTDDITVLAGTLAMVRSHITDRHRRMAREKLEAERR